MIILDIETTGTDAKLCSMLSLGAVEYETGEEFYGECSIYPTSQVTERALEINGFKREDIQYGKKQTPIELFHKFYEWAVKFPSYLLAGHNIGHLDLLFLEELARLAGWEFIFGYRTVDLHSVAFTKFHESLSHEKICDRLGLPLEPKPHNALAGARSERDAFKLLLT